jgi:hypothetical protein
MHLEGPASCNPDVGFCRFSHVLERELIWFPSCRLTCVLVMKAPPLIFIKTNSSTAKATELPIQITQPIINSENQNFAAHYFWQSDLSTSPLSQWPYYKVKGTRGRKLGTFYQVMALLRPQGFRRLNKSSFRGSAFSWAYFIKVIRLTVPCNSSSRWLCHILYILKFLFFLLFIIIK